MLNFDPCPFVNSKIVDGFGESLGCSVGCAGGSISGHLAGVVHLDCIESVKSEKEDSNYFRIGLDLIPPVLFRPATTVVGPRVGLLASVRSRFILTNRIGFRCHSFMLQV